MNKNSTLHQIASSLTLARMNKRPIPQFSQNGVVFDRASAYRIQEIGIKHRFNNGEKWMGIKMGLTSQGKRTQMNLDSPLYGDLTDAMYVKPDSLFSIHALIHPKVEPEIAFQLNSDVTSELTYDQAKNKISKVALALEILDSRYQQFKYFSMEDVIADNSSSSHFTIGNWVSYNPNWNLKNWKLNMTINDQLKQSGLASEISGDPIQSIVELSQLLKFNSRYLPANCIILSGAATAAEPLVSNSNIKLSAENTETSMIPLEIGTPSDVTNHRPLNLHLKR